MANSSMNMSENLGMTSTEIRELKLGTSFCNQGSLYHTIRYDFKPASVDVNKMAAVEVNDKNPKEVIVTVPHTDGAGVTHTVFKGSQSPIRRDCVLIIDKSTGEITLEKLHTNIIVKKTRPETASKLSLPYVEPSVPSRKPSPKHPKVRGNASPKPPSLGCIPKHSPLHASPNPSLPMIGEEVDSGYEASASGGGGYNPSTPAAEVFVPPSEQNHVPAPREQYNAPREQHVPPREQYVPSREQHIAPREQYVPPREQHVAPREQYVAAREQHIAPREQYVAPREQYTAPEDSGRPARGEVEKPYKPHPSLPPPPPPQVNGMEDLVGVLSDSSSGDSSSDGDSSDSSSDAETPRPANQGRSTNSSSVPPSAVTLLTDDLQLSDSGSDSD